MTKSFDSDERISSGDLRDLDPSRLEELLAIHRKLTLTHNDELRAVILDIHTWETLMNRLADLEDTLEDLLLSRELETRIHTSPSSWAEKPESMDRLSFLKNMAETGEIRR
ncbi:hypothetical protein [Staphylospora marina]|uniref:hypothetical protein n=1 Tax=Staphylospora marina TaxID=2490858 RepID=UPI000F5C238E|nr:hypothetical protein [Staphylospora marina]